MRRKKKKIGRKKGEGGDSNKEKVERNKEGRVGVAEVNK